MADTVAAVAPCRCARHSDSLVEAAFAGFGFRRDGCLPNYYQEQVVGELDPKEALLDAERPIVDQEDHPEHSVDMLVDARLEAKELQLDLANHWWAALSEAQGVL